MTGPVEHWQRKLAERVGMDEGERLLLKQRLLAYCARHAVEPVDLITTWREHPALTVRRRPGAVEVPDLAVESFLVHNGVNVFGDIVCVPGAPEDLAAQGAQFVRRVPTSELASESIQHSARRSADRAQGMADGGAGGVGRHSEGER